VIARSISSSQPGCPGRITAWQSSRREPAIALTIARARARSSLSRIMLSEESLGAADSSAMVVSLSRKTSFT
jgi:hypothetical protein